VPPFEKLLAEGTILEYEIDTEAIQTDNSATFAIIFITPNITPNAEGLDKFDAALAAVLKRNPMAAAAFASMVDFAAYRDFLNSLVGTYK
jgi:hypothetical protein